MSSYEQVLCCDLCGGTKNRIIDPSANILECHSCGLRFISPRPTQQDVARIYDWNYQNFPGWGKVKPQAGLIYTRRFNFLTQFVQRGRLLDVGAGLGIFLSVAKRTNNWECYGTETSSYAVDFARRQFATELSMGQLEDLKFPDNYFDAVTLWHVLEHLPYPAKAIAETRRILKNDGFLFIAVPNDAWLGRRHFFKNALKKSINRLPIKSKLKLKKMYPQIEEPGNKHLFYFTPATLSRMLNKCGFQIKRRSVDYDYEQPDPKIENKYKLELFFCQLSGINFSHAILLAAQKKPG